MKYFHFRQGRNCWRISQTERMAAIVDGQDYFAAVRCALIAARRRVFMLGWDIHSRVELVREDPQDGLPTALADLILILLERNPHLEVYVLLWDYAPIYALEREPLFFGGSRWEKHPRLRFVKDSAHPAAASQHQKVVVVDGRIAFSGGFDLSKWRWDTTNHLAVDPRRRDAENKPYPPFHDLQMLVDSDAASVLEDLCRERWERATGEEIPRLEPTASDPWPEEIVPLLRHHHCAIARTFPPYEQYTAAREVERLYLDMIRAAKRFIYIENQYLTSITICNAIRRRLRRRKGPEVVIILPRETGDWLEQHTMDVLRERRLQTLREADRHGRLRVYYPTVPGLDKGCLMVHAKLMIIDDQLLRISSSNLSNRSMGLDSECDLCTIAENQDSESAIAGLRHRLLGMFLGKDPQSVANAEARESGLIAAIESLRGDERTLEPLTQGANAHWERQLPDDRLIDPDSPLNASDLGDAMVGHHALPHARRRLWLGVGLVSILLALAAAWRWTELGTWLQPQALATQMSTVLHGTWGPGLLAATFLVGSLIAVPITLLILVTALVYGPALGAIYALGGSILAAVATYGLGYYLGRSTVERFSGSSVQSLSERLARRGILTVVAVRIVPIAPFTVINLLAGASKISLRDFFIGTLVGMVPGVAAMAVFAEGILALVRDADLKHFLVMVLVLALIVGLTLFTRHLFVQINARRTR